MRPYLQAKFFNLPNSLSFIRLLTAPVLIIMLLSPGKGASLAAAIVFALVCVTDWLDGYFARRYAIVTAFGKFLDPLADKILIVTAFIMLIPLGRVPAWLVASIVGRAIAVTGLRAVAADAGVVISASPLGKYKTIFQIVCLVPLIIHYPYFGLDFQLIGTILLVPAFILTMVSGIEYFVKFFKNSAIKDD